MFPICSKNNICSRLTEWLDPSDQTSPLIARNIFGWPTNLINIGSQWSPWLELCKSILHKSIYMDFGLASQIQSINNLNVRIFATCDVIYRSFLYDTKRIEELIWGIGSQPNIYYFLILFHRLASLSQHLHYISLNFFPPFLPIFHFKFSRILLVKFHSAS